MRTLLMLLLVLGYVSPSLAQEATAVERFVDAMNRRKAAFESIRYQFAGQQTMTVDLFKHLKITPSGVIKVKGADGPESGSLVLSFQERKFRFDQQTNMPSGADALVIPWNQVFTLNGQDFRVFFDRTASSLEDRPDMRISKPNDPGFPVYDVAPLLWAHGMITTSHVALTPAKFWEPVDKDRFVEQRAELLQNRPCIVFRSTEPGKADGSTYDEFWVDTERDHSILKAVTYTNGQPVHTFLVNYQAYGERWLPATWDYFFTIGGKPMKRYEMKIESIEENPSLAASLFEMPLKPGMTVSENGLLSRVDANGMLVPIPTSDMQPSDKQIYGSILAAFILSLLIPFGWYYLSRRRVTVPAG